jgi:hypothetical protein
LAGEEDSLWRTKASSGPSSAFRDGFEPRRGGGGSARARVGY